MQNFIKTEVRSQKSGVRSRESGVRKQNSVGYFVRLPDFRYESLFASMLMMLKPEVVLKEE
ncbi:MAG: hypothetical protein V7K53_02800 [Nostoc sp.]|uniref:hypothetical protein n=1 Tax=Nostoc sp. TaxID=1180 RepID=UPI002FFA8F3C